MRWMRKTLRRPRGLIRRRDF